MHIRGLGESIIIILDSSAYSIRLPETKILRKIIEVDANSSSMSMVIRKEMQANLAWNDPAMAFPVSRRMSRSL